MSLEKKEFIGKTVADAIKQACDTLHAPQENLEIEVVETGSTGIFGFIRKKARIRARVKEGAVDATTKPEKPVPRKRALPAQPKPEPAPTAQEPAKQAAVTPQDETIITGEVMSGDEDEDDSPLAPASEEPLSQESIDTIQHELSQLLLLMGIPSQVEIEVQGSSLRCHVSGDFEEDITGQEGKTLDSLQYLLRKITAKKITERVRISIDAGDFKEKRQDELEDLARELAVLVKGDGKTQVIPSLNPSERRVVHMTLQDDKEIRSRSVGEGLFKKVLIYKPGKPRSGGGGSAGTGGTGSGPKKRSSSRGRRGKGNKPTPETPEQE
jgi:spoIIIJ-associated protein